MAGRRMKVALAAAVVLVAGGAVGFKVARDRRDQVVVQTGPVGRRDLVSVVSASGEVRPQRYVNVGANVSGRIERLLVVEGQTVKKGQILARIESTRFAAGTRQSEAAVSAARAELQSGEADLEATRLAWERTRQMHADKLVSDEAREQAEAAFRMKSAAVAALRGRIAQQSAVLESNQDDLEKTTVLSPMDGVVTALQKEEGEVVIGAQSFSPTVILTVADLSVMVTEVLVDETDIRNVHLAQRAEIRVDALEGVKLQGEVTEIGASAIPRNSSGTAAIASGSSATTANQAKDFKVTITLKDPPPELRPGLNATADITTATRTGVLAVPIQAVVIREVDPQGQVVDPDTGPKPEESGAPRVHGEEKEGVFVVDAEKATFRPVKVGIMGDTEIEVAEGVQEGQEIVTGSYRTLRTIKDGGRIRREEKKGGKE